MGFKGTGAHVDGRRFVFLHETRQTAAVIVMPVGQYCHFHFAQINAQFFRVVREGAGRAGVK